MWDTSFYTSQSHRGGDRSASSASAAPASHPPPTGVLSPDLARPISVRELAQSRVPAVPPPRASARPDYLSNNASSKNNRNGNGGCEEAVPLPRPSTGFAGFGVPRAPVVYAATSGVLPNWLSTHSSNSVQLGTFPSELSTHSEASDLTSLAYRNIDHLTNDDLYNYASYLQDAAKRYSSHLSEAYAKRDAYRSQVADLNQKLQEEYLKTDLLRRSREKADDALQKLREDNTQLRHLLVEAEGKARNLSAKLSQQNGADPSVVIRSLQSQLTHKEAQLRELSERLLHESEVHHNALEETQRYESGSGVNPRQPDASGAAETDGKNQKQSEDFSIEMEERVRREVMEASAQAVAAATAHLHSDLDDLQQRHDVLQTQLETQATAHAAALGRAASHRAELMDKIALLEQEKVELQTYQDQLVSALTQRAPVSKADFEDFQATYAELQAELQSAKATVSSLQEQQNDTENQAGYVAELEQSLTTLRTQQQELTQANSQLQSLVDNLDREVQLAGASIRLLQEQLATSVADGQRLAHDLQRAETAEEVESDAFVQELQMRCEQAEEEVRRQQAEKEELQRQLQELLSQPANQTNSNESNNSSQTTDSVAARMEREKAELEAELETLRNTLDSLEVSRDALINELRSLEERRQQKQRETENTQAVSGVALSAFSEHEAEADVATLRAAQESVTALQRDLEATHIDHASVGADVQSQPHTLEKKLTEQTGALRAASEYQKQAEAADHHRATAADAAQKFFEEVIEALKEELELTQVQVHELRQSESEYKERYSAELRLTEQLRERVVELEKVAVKGMESSPATATEVAQDESDSNTAVMSAAVDKLAEQLADAQDRVLRLEAERCQLAEELQHSLRPVVVLEEECGSKTVEKAGQKAHIYNGGAELASSEHVAALTTQRNMALQEAAQVREMLGALEVRMTAVVLERDVAQEELRTAKTALDLVVAESSTLTLHANSLTASVSQLKAEAAQLAAERDATATNLSVARAALDRVVEEVAVLTERVNSLTATNAQLVSECDAKEQRVNAAIEEARLAHAALEKTADELASSEQSAHALSATNAGLESSNAFITKELSAAHDTVTALVTERDTLKSLNAELQAHVETIGSNGRAPAAAEQDALQLPLRTVEETLRTAQSALERMAEEASDVTQRAEALSRASDTAEVDRMQAVAEIARLQQALSEAEARASEVERCGAEALTASEKLVASHAARIADLESESNQLKTDLSVARRAVTSLSEEHNAHADVDAELQKQVEVSEARAVALACERDAAQEELRTTKAALEKMAGDLLDSAHRAETLSSSVTYLRSEREQLATERDVAQKRADAAENNLFIARAELQKLTEQLTAAVQLGATLSCAQSTLETEKAQQGAALTALQQALSDAEARAADVAKCSVEAASAFEKLAAAHTAQIAELKKEKMQLKEELSIACSAVSNLAEDCTTVNTQSAILQRQLEAETNRRRSVESTVVALKRDLATAQAAVTQLADDAETRKANDEAMQAALEAQKEALELLKTQHNRDSEDLVEVSRRAEELQRLLNNTLDSLAQAEESVKKLNDNAAELDAERTTLSEALDTVVVDRQNLLERLDAVQVGLDQTATLYNERILEENRLQEELNAVTKAFAAQTEQMKVGVAYMLQMSEGFRSAVTAALGSAAETTKAAAELATAALAFDAKNSVRKSITLEKQSNSDAVSAIDTAMESWSAALHWVAQIQRRAYALDASQIGKREDCNERAAGNTAEDMMAAAALCRNDASEARAVLMDFMEQQAASLCHLHKVQHALSGRDNELLLMRLALDRMAGENVEEKERVSNLLHAIQDAKDHVSAAEREFEEQLQLRSHTIAAELVVARRAEERATDARVRAETKLEAVEAELRETQTKLQKLEEEKRRLSRETERLSRFSTRMVDASTRMRSAANGSVTPSTTTLYADSTSPHYEMSASAIEALEQAHLLQVSSLQQELLLCRRQVRKLEGQETALRQAYLGLEQQVTDLRVEAAEASDLREELEALRAENAEWEEKNAQLQRVMDATQRSMQQELTQLRQQLKVKVSELEEHKTRLQMQVLGKTTPQFEALRRQEAFKENLSGITMQLAATEAQYSRGVATSPSASPQNVYTSRIEHLETLVNERDIVIEKLQAAQLQARVEKDNLEETLSEKAIALDQMSELNAQYAETIEALRTVGVSVATRVATPRRSTEVSHCTRSQLDPVSPPTPLSLQPSLHANSVGDTKGLAMPSPAPRIPNLDDVAVEGEKQQHKESGKPVGDTEEAEATSTSPATSRRRTEAAGESSIHGGRCSRRVRSTSLGTTSLNISPRSSSNAGKTTSLRKRGR